MGYLKEHATCKGRVPFQCDHCSNLGFRLKKYVLRNEREGKNHFVYCSVMCLRSYQRSEITIICDECSVEFLAQPSLQRKFCSSRCSGISSNRKRTAESRAKQAKTLREGDHARRNAESYLLISKAHRRRYADNPKRCNICVKPLEWEARYRKTCSDECLHSSMTRPETAKKIADTRRRKFADGSLNVTGGNTQWFDYKGIRVQGSFELRTCSILDRWQETGEIASWEYTFDRIPYVRNDGQTATYLPDFKIWNDSGVGFCYLEVKGYQREHDAEKWAATRNAGYELIVWFEKDIIDAEN